MKAKWGLFTNFQFMIFQFNTILNSFALGFVFIYCLFYTISDPAQLILCTFFSLLCAYNLYGYSKIFDNRPTNKQLSRNEENYLVMNSIITCCLFLITSFFFFIAQNENGYLPIYLRLVGVPLISYVVYNFYLIFTKNLGETRFKDS